MGGVGVPFHISFTSTHYEGEWLASSLGPRAALNLVEKKNIPCPCQEYNRNMSTSRK
jgi:hypothetical protein